MTIDPHRLLKNPVVPRQMVIDLATQLEANERRLERVRNILEQLLKRRFGPKREKLDERQLFLFAVELEAHGGDVKEILAELEQEPESKPGDEPDPPAADAAGQPAKPRGHGRRPLPRGLRRERVEPELSEAERTCPHCAKTMERIGEEVSERLEYVPASLHVIEEARAKYACSCGGALKTAAKPAQPITARCTGRKWSSGGTAPSYRARRCAAGWGKTADLLAPAESGLARRLFGSLGPQLRATGSSGGAGRPPRRG